jgi:ATP-dependent Lhr-like helicase
MLAVYRGDDSAPYLDKVAAGFLVEGRLAFQGLGLERRRLVEFNRDTHVLTWRGSATNGVLAVVLASLGLDCEAHDIGVTVANATALEVGRIIDAITSVPDLDALAAKVANLRTAKYDEFVPEALLRKGWIQSNLRACEEIPLLLQEIKTTLS